MRIQTQIVRTLRAGRRDRRLRGSARHERDGPDWYIGAITDEEPRTLEISLSFLPRGESYGAEICADGEGAHRLRDPYPTAI